MVTFAVLFPGQGSQHVGMGADLFEARGDLLGDRADEILGWSLRRMCLDGPEDALTRTEHAQPALYALSYALWTLFQAEIPGAPSAGAGHSLGEYTALAAASAIGFEDGLRVVSRRGRAMAAAADAEPSGMAALIGADEQTSEKVAAACRAEGGRLQVANLNAPGQVVVAGGEEDIEWVAENGAGLGVRRVIPLKVAGAFHSSFMEPAIPDLEAALADVSLTDPAFPVWSNTMAAPHVLSELADALVRQVVSPVRFAQSLTGMAAAGVGTFVHVGPGDVTAGMVRKTVPEAEVLVVSGSGDVGAAAQALGTM